MKSIIDNLMSLGRNRLIALGATGVGITLALLFGLNTVMAPTFSPLYNELTAESASNIVGTLEQAGIKVEVTGGGSVVSVPQEDIARARMVLADSGLPSAGVPGWELFDGTSGLGMNTFMQRINRLRALEGELARSIQTIDGVDAARVHLVLPEREAFSRNRPEPSASVIVRGRANHMINRRQGVAIRALVASAVPDLATGRVTVLSASGETILSDDIDGNAEVTLQSTRVGIEEQMASNIAGILTARVGAGNARVQVSVDLSAERQVILSQSYDPGQQVVRSTETREEKSDGQENGNGEVNVGANLPGALAGGAAGGGARSQNSRATTDEIVNYEIGSTRSEITREPGEIMRVSVAVLVNGIYNVQPDGSVVYEERSAAELDRLGQLVKTAVGFDLERGDAVSVDSLRFMDYSMDVGEPVGLSLTQAISTNIMAILRGLFALAVVAVIVLFGVRPMLNRLLPNEALEDQSGPAPDALVDSRPDALALESGGVAAVGPPPTGNSIAIPQAQDQVFTGAVLDPHHGDQGELITLASVQGGVHRRRLASIGAIVDGEPNESLKVLQSWLAGEA